MVEAGMVLVDSNSQPVEEFLISKTEIPNSLYRAFYLEVMLSSNAAIAAPIVSPDTGAWECKAMRQYYFNHMVYESYPVSGVSQEAALLFCAWLTTKYGYLFGNDYYFDLPTRAEWIKAANGRGTGPYAWGGPFLRNSQGDYLCNFKVIGEQRISSNNKAYIIMAHKEVEAFSEYGLIFTPVLAYYPNDYGLYNMNGNVAEWVKEPGIAVGGSYRNTGYDVRNQSFKVVEGKAIDVGFRPVVRTKKQTITPAF